MRLKKITGFFVGVIALMLAAPSCTLKLDGSSIPPGMKTINVNYFENNAPFVVNNLSQQFTEALKVRIRSQTRLNIVRTEEADASFSGYISNYSIAPVSIQTNASNTNAPPIADGSRLTVTVKVKYTVNLKSTNKNEKKSDFEQEFTKTADFKGDIASQEQALIARINKDLTEDIFNKAFADW
jgi:hypothetical protein